MARKASWATLAGLALVMTVGGCDPGSPEAKPSTCAIPTAPPAGTYATAGQAPGGGGVEVVGHGFTQFSGPAGRNNPWPVSLGALVRNTSDQVAYRTQVTMRIKDAQGRDAVHPLNASGLVLEIPVIRPGEQVAVGTKAGTREDVTPVGESDRVTSFGVELGSTTWLSTADAASLPTFTATFRGIGRDRDDILRFGVQYSVTTTSCRQMTSRGTAVVFVNPAGEVVGGSLENVGETRHCGTEGYVAANQNGDVPAGIDEAKTVVSEYCDVARPGGGVYRPSGAPFN